MHVEEEYYFKPLDGDCEPLSGARVAFAVYYESRIRARVSGHEVNALERISRHEYQAYVGSESYLKFMKHKLRDVILAEIGRVMFSD